MDQQKNKFRPVADDSALQDVEAHKIYRNSNADIKHDVEDVAWEDEDTEGHRVYAKSDTGLKHDVEDVSWDDEDTEGHAKATRF